ncbi:hypothetical protein E5Q_03687 [Mixia osmundae IAM 14324]|uniref:Uncharacterized protein n=1 Tax=Mixia osmundae (strain CBS 9802 / IAM 14324 / JCM 22182 / KY 12970) TaxID=764103 RepID=G7E2F3_MIXOS|nr:hypothetical protein E5Q_03687 [Mixia osmundae IAM 14324]
MARPSQKQASRAALLSSPASNTRRSARSSSVIVEESMPETATSRARSTRKGKSRSKSQSNDISDDGSDHYTKPAASVQARPRPRKRTTFEDLNKAAPSPKQATLQQMAERARTRQRSGGSDVPVQGTSRSTGIIIEDAETGKEADYLVDMPTFADSSTEAEMPRASRSRSESAADHYVGALEDDSITLPSPPPPPVQEDPGIAGMQINEKGKERASEQDEAGAQILQEPVDLERRASTPKRPNARTNDSALLGIRQTPGLASPFASPIPGNAPFSTARRSRTVSSHLTGTPLVRTRDRPGSPTKLVTTHTTDKYNIIAQLVSPGKKSAKKRDAQVPTPPRSKSSGEDHSFNNRSASWQLKRATIYDSEDSEFDATEDYLQGVNARIPGGATVIKSWPVDENTVFLLKMPDSEDAQIFVDIAALGDNPESMTDVIIDRMKERADDHTFDEDDFDSIRTVIGQQIAQLVDAEKDPDIPFTELEDSRKLSPPITSTDEEELGRARKARPRANSLRDSDAYVPRVPVRQSPRVYHRPPTVPEPPEEDSLSAQKKPRSKRIPKAARTIASPVPSTGRHERHPLHEVRDASLDNILDGINDDENDLVPLPHSQRDERDDYGGYEPDPFDDGPIVMRSEDEEEQLEDYGEPLRDQDSASPEPEPEPVQPFMPPDALLAPLDQPTTDSQRSAPLQSMQDPMLQTEAGMVAAGASATGIPISSTGVERSPPAIQSPAEALNLAFPGQERQDLTEPPRASTPIAEDLDKSMEYVWSPANSPSAAPPPAPTSPLAASSKQSSPEAEQPSPQALLPALIRLPQVERATPARSPSRASPSPVTEPSPIIKASPVRPTRFARFSPSPQRQPNPREANAQAGQSTPKIYRPLEREILTTPGRIVQLIEKSVDTGDLLLSSTEVEAKLEPFTPIKREYVAGTASVDLRRRPLESLADFFVDFEPTPRRTPYRRGMTPAFKAAIARSPDKIQISEMNADFSRAAIEPSIDQNAQSSDDMMPDEQTDSDDTVNDDLEEPMEYAERSEALAEALAPGVQERIDEHSESEVPIELELPYEPEQDDQDESFRPEELAEQEDSMEPEYVDRIEPMPYLRDVPVSRPIFANKPIIYQPQAQTPSLIRFYEPSVPASEPRPVPSVHLPDVKRTASVVTTPLVAELTGAMASPIYGQSMTEALPVPIPICAQSLPVQAPRQTISRDRSMAEPVTEDIDLEHTPENSVPESEASEAEDPLPQAALLSPSASDKETTSSNRSAQHTDHVSRTNVHQASSEEDTDLDEEPSQASEAEIDLIEAGELSDQENLPARPLRAGRAPLRAQPSRNTRQAVVEPRIGRGRPSVEMPHLQSPPTMFPPAPRAFRPTRQPRTPTPLIQQASTQHAPAGRASHSRQSSAAPISPYIRITSNDPAAAAKAAAILKIEHSYVNCGWRDRSSSENPMELAQLIHNAEVEQSMIAENRRSPEKSVASDSRSRRMSDRLSARPPRPLARQLGALGTERGWTKPHWKALENAYFAIKQENVGSKVGVNKVAERFLREQQIRLNEIVDDFALDQIKARIEAMHCVIRRKRATKRFQEALRARTVSHDETGDDFSHAASGYGREYEAAKSEAARVSVRLQHSDESHSFELEQDAPARPEKRLPLPPRFNAYTRPAQPVMHMPQVSTSRMTPASSTPRLAASSARAQYAPRSPARRPRAGIKSLISTFEGIAHAQREDAELSRSLKRRTSDDEMLTLPRKRSRQAA